MSAILTQSPIWSVCLQLAVEAFDAGSLGISAVIVDPEGTIVSKGRNQLWDNLESCNGIRRTQVAHAEMNALNNLAWEQQLRRDLTLYTTVEPCPMCLGAIAMSRIRSVRVASADPHAGATRLLCHDEYLRAKNIAVSFERGNEEKLFFAVHYLSLRRRLRNRTEHPIFLSFDARYPLYVCQLEKLIDSASFSLGNLVLGKSHLLEKFLQCG